MLPVELTGDAPEWRLGVEKPEKAARAAALGQGMEGPSRSLLWALLVRAVGLDRTQRLF